MFSKSNLEAASRRAAFVVTVALFGMSGLAFSASAQGLTNQGPTQLAPAAEAAPATPAAPVTVRQAVTEVVQQQPADDAQAADAAPADATPANAAPAPNAAPVVKQGQRRFVHSLPIHPTYKSPSYGHNQAYAPAPHHVKRHVVHPQHFGYRHVQHGYAARSYSHGGYGHGFRVTSGYNGHSRH